MIKAVIQSTTKKTPELIIFDCDGVLVDSEVIFNEVLRDDLAGYGLELSVKESMNLFVGGSMESVQAAVATRGIELPSHWVELLYSKVETRLGAGVDVVEGIPELLKALTDKAIPFCVASNGPIKKMLLTLGQNDLLTYFENGLFSAYELNSWKPEPTLFLHAAKQFGIAPENCLVIEDSLNGTLAAKNAKMPCLAYAPEGHNEALAETGASCFTAMAEIPALIGLST